jgi:hypothetical protein
MTQPRSTQGEHPEADLPWWRVGMVWLVLGGPAVVVVAAIVTAGIAIHDADPIVHDPVVTRSTATSAETPAMQARNHAASPSR